MYRKNDLPKFILPVRPEPDERERIQSALKNISARTLVCHGCGRCGCMVPHGTYRRGITYEREGKVVDSFVMVPVFYCPFCNYCHAILTDFLIPFCSFTLRFVLCALKDYLERPRGVTVREICARYQVSLRTLYTWKKRFLGHLSSFAASVDLLSIPEEPYRLLPAAALDACGEPGPSPEPPQIPSQATCPCRDKYSALYASMATLLKTPFLPLSFFSLFGFSFLQGNPKKHLKDLPRPDRA